MECGEYQINRSATPSYHAHRQRPAPWDWHEDNTSVTTATQSAGGLLATARLLWLYASCRYLPRQRYALPLFSRAAPLRHLHGGSGVGATMPPEGQDNLQSQAFLGWKRNSVLLEGHVRQLSPASPCSREAPQETALVCLRGEAGLPGGLPQRCSEQQRPD